jgi:hypothetical protein
MAKHTPTEKRWILAFSDARDAHVLCEEDRSAGELEQVAVFLGRSNASKARAEGIVRAVNAHDDMLRALIAAKHELSDLLSDPENSRAMRAIDAALVLAEEK